MRTFAATHQRFVQYSLARLCGHTLLEVDGTDVIVQRHKPLQLKPLNIHQCFVQVDGNETEVINVLG